MTNTSIETVKPKDNRSLPWIRGVRCAKGHSGNRRIYQGTPYKFWECAGCGQVYHESGVAHRQQNPGGENMAGGLYSVDEPND